MDHDKHQANAHMRAKERAEATRQAKAAGYGLLAVLALQPSILLTFNHNNDFQLYVGLSLLSVTLLLLTGLGALARLNANNTGHTGASSAEQSD